MRAAAFPCSLLVFSVVLTDALLHDIRRPFGVQVRSFNTVATCKMVGTFLSLNMCLRVRVSPSLLHFGKVYIVSDLSRVGK
jgi:hypothetical protein